MYREPTGVIIVIVIVTMRVVQRSTWLLRGPGKHESRQQYASEIDSSFLLVKVSLLDVEFIHKTGAGAA